MALKGPCADETKDRLENREHLLVDITRFQVVKRGHLGEVDSTDSFHFQFEETSVAAGNLHFQVVKHLLVTAAQLE